MTAKLTAEKKRRVQVYQDKMDRTNQLMHELSVQKQMIASQTCQLDSMNTKF